MNLNDAVRNLANSIIMTKEFSDLKHEKANIDRNKDLKSRLENLRKKEMELYSGKLSIEEAKHLSLTLSKAFEELSGNIDIARFTKAEKAFNGLLQKTYSSLNETLDRYLSSK